MSVWIYLIVILCFLCVYVYFCVYFSHVVSIISVFCTRLSYIIKTYLIWFELIRNIKLYRSLVSRTVINHCVAERAVRMRAR